jgi:hypothetical protein
MIRESNLTRPTAVRPLFLLLCFVAWDTPELPKARPEEQWVSQRVRINE